MASVGVIDAMALFVTPHLPFDRSEFPSDMLPIQGGADAMYPSRANKTYRYQE
jgi:hypothetical protein